MARVGFFGLCLVYAAVASFQIYTAESAANKPLGSWSVEESADIKNDLLGLRIMTAKFDEREVKFRNQLDALKVEIQEAIKLEVNKLASSLQQTLTKSEAGDEQKITAALTQIKADARQVTCIESNAEIRGFKSEFNQIKTLINEKVSGLGVHFRSSGLEQCYGVHSGYDLSPGSNDLFNRWNMDLGACCAFCKQTKGCKAFVWDKGARICHLKAVTGPKHADDRFVAGYSDSSVDGKDQCSAVDSGLDYSPGSEYDIATNTTDLSGCCDFCKKTADCKAFVWSKSTGTCWAKNVDYPRVLSEDRISGLPNRKTVVTVKPKP